METTNAHVFISYSRRNIEFAKRLYAELNKNNRDIWVDWEDIPRGTDWLQEIFAGIDRADTFIFLVSPYSLISEICNQELSYALKANKRVIPLILHQIDDPVFNKIDAEWKKTDWYPVAHKNWDALKHLNWIFFDNPEKYDSEFEALLETVDQDLYHIKTHTRLLVRAREWIQKEKNASYLLIGDDILSAEHWIQTYVTTDPLPTVLHKEYIQESRKRENERIAHERRLQRSARIRLQILVASFIVIILSIVFGLLPLTRTLLDTQLGDETDERLHEAALSFEELMQDDLFTAELAARFVSSSIDPEALRDRESEAFETFDQLRNDFELQEISFYPRNFQMGDPPGYYIGPEITHNDRVQAVRESLVLEAMNNDSDEAESRLIIGSPESQIIAAISIPGRGAGDNWVTPGVVLVAYHVNDAYIERIAEILNVEAILINQEEEIVATTLIEEHRDILEKLTDSYENAHSGNLFGVTSNAYLDYDDYEGDTLRIIEYPLALRGEIQGYLFVGRSFDAVINLENQISTMFLTFSGGILVIILVLLVALIGIPALQNRARNKG